MAQSNVIVRLSLKDAEVVRKGLEALGADSEKALKRIDAAGRAPSAGLKALGVACDELKGSLGNLAGSAGSVGTALEALGPRGLMAAAGIGAVVIVLGKLISAARQAGDFFAQLGDDAERAGTSASKLATLQGVFIANAASAEEANSALVRLRGVIDDAMSGSDQAQQAFQNVGISMEWLSKNGGDTVDVLMKIAQHSGLTAGQMNDLTGKIGNALIPAMEALAKVGVQANEEFDTLTKEINETKDRVEILDRQMQALSMNNAKAYLEAVETIKTGLRDLEAWFLRTANANAVFWQRLGQAKMSDWLWGDPIKDALTERDKALETEKKTQEDRMAIVAGQVKTEQALRNVRVPYAGSLSSGKGAKPKKARTAHEPKIDWEFGKPFEADIARLNALSESGLTDTQKNAKETMERIVEANLRANGEIIKLIEMRRDKELDALNLVALSTEEKATARQLIEDTYSRQIADEYDKLIETTEKTDESAFDLTATFQGFGQVASSAFEDAIVKGEELSTVMSGLAEDIQRLLLRGTMNKLFELGIDAASGALGRWWGGSSLSLEGGTGAGGYTTGGFQTTPSFMPSAAGNVFYAGNVIPFARGGIVSRPTIFPMARGMGLMGEAGPEAVMPLTRLPSGKLGVGAEGAIVNNVQVINNYPGACVSSEEQKNDRGGMNLTVVIDALENAMAQRATRPGTTLNRALATASNPVKAR